ncbi:MAG: acetyl/propionyl-CoA carboxylase subunit alpha, partial [Microbacteriaceae bacterium]|nr:acetyl/propionyl-CoA carboxylase subunit alpha [Microbacteriaceae bacterium]
MFSTVLVANRGEIACRVLRTLRTMGIRSVAVYSDADRSAKHVMMADSAIRIGPAPAQSSYLSVDAVIAAAKASGAEAIHPGYGFLSENAQFATACAEAGIVFIGPGVQALEIMGDKIRAKAEVSARGVAVIEGTDGAGMDGAGVNDAGLIAATSEIAFPLLVKPSAGGGGKGMQVVNAAGELPAALATARRIAAAAFGNDTLLLERYIDTPRHIEVQILADNTGAVIHLGERECSLQRRHQKVIEEAPSPLLDAATRARIGEAACEVARSVDYRGAGTVEFLVSAAAPGDFYFIEMNTRLQVEHPVTELVTGIDLVEWQLRIAAGEPLAMGNLPIVGHAIEARVYAENAARGFLPSTGTVLLLDEPGEPGEQGSWGLPASGVRVDSSLLPGLTIGGDYDPMLAKVIAHGSDRAEALRRLDAALAGMTVLGVHTNIEFLRALLADDAVRAGDIDTGLIERALPGIRFRQPDPAMLAAAALHVHSTRWTAARPPWHEPTGWRIGAARQSSYRFAIGATDFVDVLVGGAPDAAIVTVGDGDPTAARLLPLLGGSVSVEFGGHERVIRLAQHGRSLWLGDRGFSCELVLRTREEQLADLLASTTRAVGTASPDLRSPMPGTVVAVEVSAGDTVSAGQVLLTVEAMKMEHKLLAPVAGVVEITVTPGDLVALDQVVAR